MAMMIKVFLIDTDRKCVCEENIPASHDYVEELLGTRLWTDASIRDYRSEKLFFSVVEPATPASFAFCSFPYSGNAVIARHSDIGDLESSELSLGEVQSMVKWL